MPQTGLIDEIAAKTTRRWKNPLIFLEEHLLLTLVIMGLIVDVFAVMLYRQQGR